jgi:hypothetical protein
VACKTEPSYTRPNLRLRDNNARDAAHCLHTPRSRPLCGLRYYSARAEGAPLGNAAPRPAGPKLARATSRE